MTTPCPLGEDRSPVLAGPSTRSSDTIVERVVAPGTRALLLVFATLTLVATNQLLVLADATEVWFAWTIQPALTAAFLGSGYAAGFVLVVLVLRTRRWVQARLTLVSVLAFTALSLVATLLHADRFHFDASGVVARFAAWFWLMVYVVVPVGLVAVIVSGHRSSGSDPPAGPPLTPWLRVALLTHAVVLLPVGTALFVLPSTAPTLWPWVLTPLTARMVAAWLVAFGLVALGAVLENDLDRLAGTALAYAVFGLLQILALALYGGDAVHWGSTQATGYLIFLATVPLIGAAGWRAAYRYPHFAPRTDSL